MIFYKKKHFSNTFSEKKKKKCSFSVILVYTHNQFECVHDSNSLTNFFFLVKNHHFFRKCVKIDQFFPLLQTICDIFGNFNTHMYLRLSEQKITNIYPFFLTKFFIKTT